MTSTFKMWLLLITFSATVGVSHAHTGRIIGAIKEALTQQPVEMANIIIQTQDTTFAGGTTSDDEGKFSLPNLKAGNYTLKVSSIGYETLTKEVTVAGGTTHTGTLTLKESTSEVQEVVVSGAAVVNKFDKKLFMLTDNQKKGATNGIDILKKLVVPKVKYNAFDNTLSATDRGELNLRINGVTATQTDIKALNPEDIIRIEYHDSPSLRYGDASVVLDYIVKRKESGGNLNLSLRNSPIVGFGDDNLSAKVNHKKSEFGLTYYGSYRDLYKMYRNSTEQYRFENGSLLERVEEGTPDQLQRVYNYGNASYNLQVNDSSKLNVSLRFQNTNIPHLTFHSRIYNTQNPERKVDMWDKQPATYSAPSIDIYYETKLKKNQTLFFNLVGNYNRGNSSRIYQEQTEGVYTTDVNTNILSNTYSIIGEGIYEKEVEKGKLSFGIRHKQLFANNRINSGGIHHTEMSQSDTYLFGEWKGKVKKLDYTVGIGGTRNWYVQKGEKGYQHYTFRPTVTLQYNITNDQRVRLKVNARNASPTLSDLSSVDQAIDSLQIHRGNPNLKPYIDYRGQLNYEIKKGIFTGNLSGGYTYCPDAIMEEKFMENGKFVKSSGNQKSFQKADAEMTLSISPFQQKLTVTLTGGVDHFASIGNRYDHRYTNFYYNVSANMTVKKFNFGFEVFNGRNWFYGETLYGAENHHILSASYRHKNFTVGALMLNPFFDAFKQIDQNWNALASYNRTTYINESARLLALNFTYNLNFGRAYTSKSNRLRNTDSDSGVTSAGK